MATLDWHHTRTSGVTLVELLVETEQAARIRIESELTPVWPPRRQGVPAAGWDDNSFETTVAADDRLVVGYATPAEPDGRPATAETEPADSTAADGAVDPQTLLRALGEAKPPRDLIPKTEQAVDSGEEIEVPAAADVTGTGTVVADRTVTTNQGSETGGQPQSTAGLAGDTAKTGENRAVEALDAWFGAVENRLRTAEQLAGIESVEQATEAVATAGGIEGVRQLQVQLAADREQLARLSERQQQLANRLNTVEIPTGVLERVA